MSRKWGKTDSQKILGGKAEVYKTEASGYWFFRMWVAPQKKYFKKSLGVESKRLAIDKGEQETINILARVQSGANPFGISVGEMVDNYLAYREADVGREGGITAGRFVTIKSQLKHFQRIIKRGTKVADLSRNSLYDYRQKRQKGGTALVTIRNEQATINSMIRYTHTREEIHFDKLNFETIRMRETEKSVRGTFTLDEYDKVILAWRSYVAKKNCVDEYGEFDEKEQLERLLMRDYFYISTNTLMRVGELRQLTWGDIGNVSELEKDTAGRDIQLVEVNVRAETSKVRKSRLVTVRGGQYFQRLLARLGKVESSALVFCQPDNGKPITSRAWSRHWHEIMRLSEVTDYRARKIEWYSLRHFGISMRVNAGVPVLDVARIAGTSSTHVETTYLKYDNKRMAQAMRLGLISDDGSLPEPLV